MIAKLIFVASIADIVIVYAISSLVPVFCQSNCAIVEVVVHVPLYAGGFPVSVVR